jgi:uncharacterized protein Yka (UPF0111/DUF47 family)
MGKKSKTKMSETADALGELATLDEVTAQIPTDKEQRNGIYPSWCDLVLEIKRDADSTIKDGPATFPLSHRMPLRRHDGELIIEVLDSVLHPGRAGGTADTIWMDLDDCIDRIMKRVQHPKKDPKPEDVGEAVGLTKALARLVMPYEPDEDAIRDIAMERYAIRNRLK